MIYDGICIAIIIIAILFPLIKKSHFIYSMIISNFIIFFIMIFSSPDGIPSHSSVLKDLSFNPVYFTTLSKMHTIITSMFIHYDVMHLLGNMIALFFIGIPFEYRIGRFRIAIVYILGGIFATIFFSIFDFHPIFLLGASGAIFALLGGFAAVFPNDRIVVPIPFMIVFFARMRVITAAILFSFIQIFFTIASPYYQTNVAYLAHIGGLIGGVVIGRIVARKKEERLHDYTFIEPFVKTDRQKEIYKRIEEAQENEIKDAWFSLLIKEIRCPICNGRVEVRNGKIYCRRCGYIR